MWWADCDLLWADCDLTQPQLWLLVWAVTVWCHDGGVESHGVTVSHAAVWSLTENTAQCDVTVRPPVRPQPAWPRPAPAWVVEVVQQDNHEHHHHHHHHHHHTNTTKQLSWHKTTNNSPVDSWISHHHTQPYKFSSCPLKTLVALNSWCCQ